MEPFSLNIRGQLIRYARPVVMGIMNVTPDSFFEESRSFDESDLERRLETLLDEGADIIDVGGCSTRPGATEVPAEEETERLARAMKIVRRVAPDSVVSVDTFRAPVAEIAVREFGADIINDISGTNLDPEMVSTVSKLKVPYVLTHSRGSLRDMHEFTDYENVTSDVLSELGDRLQWLALEGVNDIIIDPGIGFSKTLEQNYRLIHDLEVFKILHRPVLMGISRKSLITKLLGITPKDSLNATTALNMICLDRGADILRVHDVKAARQAVEIYSAVSRPDSIYQKSNQLPDLSNA